MLWRPCLTEPRDARDIPFPCGRTPPRSERGGEACRMAPGYWRGDSHRTMTTASSIACIRRFCLDCQGGSPRAVRECPDGDCRLHAWRLAALGKGGKEMLRAARRAVRGFCLLCAGGRTEVRRCAARDGCPLWRYRFGVCPHTYRRVRRRFFAPRPLSLLSAPMLPPPADENDAGPAARQHRQ